MIRLIVRHPVADYDAWRRVYDDFDEERRELGVADHAVYQSVDDPRDVTVWHDFATARAARLFATSDRLRKRMADAGVAGEPEMWLVTETS